MIVLGLTVAMSIQTIGALSAVPGGDARRRGHAGDRVADADPVADRDLRGDRMVGGILLALGGTLPISPYVTTISFPI